MNPHLMHWQTGGQASQGPEEMVPSTPAGAPHQPRMRCPYCQYMKCPSQKLDVSTSGAFQIFFNPMRLRMYKFFESLSPPWMIHWRNIPLFRLWWLIVCIKVFRPGFMLRYFFQGIDIFIVNATEFFSVKCLDYHYFCPFAKMHLHPLFIY